MQVYKENDLTKEQYDQFGEYIPLIRLIAIENFAIGIDKNLIIFSANTHEMLFGKPRPNTNSSAALVVMFRNIFRKIKEYEAKNYAVKTEIPPVTAPRDSRKNDGKTHFGRSGRR